MDLATKLYVKSKLPLDYTKDMIRCVFTGSVLSPLIKRLNDRIYEVRMFDSVFLIVDDVNIFLCIGEDLKHIIKTICYTYSIDSIETYCKQDILKRCK